jgi:sec-independent protein translocase protein TatA
LIVVLILFGGKGKLSSIMGDFGKGLKNFKDQVKSSKETIEVDAIDETSENKPKTAKKPSTSKTTKKKQTIKKKS